MECFQPGDKFKLSQIKNNESSFSPSLESQKSDLSNNREEEKDKVYEINSFSDLSEKKNLHCVNKNEQHTEISEITDNTEARTFAHLCTSEKLSDTRTEKSPDIKSKFFSLFSENEFLFKKDSFFSDLEKDLIKENFKVRYLLLIIIDYSFYY